MAGSLNMLAMMPDVMLGCGLISLISGLLMILYFCKQSRKREKLEVSSYEEKLRVDCDYKIVKTKE